MTIILKGGSADGETYRVPDDCILFRRTPKAPDARYKITDRTDERGRRIFEHRPLMPGQAEPTEGVHDA